MLGGRIFRPLWLRYRGSLKRWLDRGLPAIAGDSTSGPIWLPIARLDMPWRGD